jgi:hypothetical protein
VRVSKACLLCRHEDEKPTSAAAHRRLSGGSAAMRGGSEDPWLCGPGFRRVPLS